MDEFLDPNLNAPAVKYCSNYFVIFFSACIIFFYTLFCTDEDVNMWP